MRLQEHAGYDCLVFELRMFTFAGRTPQFTGHGVDCDTCGVPDPYPQTLTNLPPGVHSRELVHAHLRRPEGGWFYWLADVFTASRRIYEDIFLNRNRLILFR